MNLRKRYTEDTCKNPEVVHRSTGALETQIRRNKMPQCTHVYGCRPEIFSYEEYEEDSSIIWRMSPDEDDHHFWEEFDYCPRCGILLSKEK